MWENSQKDGDDAEARFDEVVKALNGESRPSTEDENKYSHIDRYVTLDGHTFTVDVKAIKSDTRHGSKARDVLWVEFQNIYGYKGWLRGGQQYIAFELELHKYLLVARARLEWLCGVLVKPVFVDKPEDAMYKLYSRDGRSDVLTKIKVRDVTDHITHKMLTMG